MTEHTTTLPQGTRPPGCRDELVTSELSRVEVVRAVMPAGPAAAAAARRLTAGLAQLTLSRRILDSASA